MSLATIALLFVTANHTIDLRPSMPPLDEVGAPALWELQPDADRMTLPLLLETDEPYRWVFPPGDVAKITAEVGSTLNAEGGLLTVWDWRNVAIAQIELDAPCEDAIDFIVEGNGAYLITLDARVDGAYIHRQARSFAMLPDGSGLRDVWNNGSFFVGTCSFPERQLWGNDYGPAHPPGLTPGQSRELDAELTARLGLQVVRYSPAAGQIWPAEDQPIDFTESDVCAQVLTQHGMRLALQVIGTPDWMVQDQYADVTDPKWRYPAREEPWRAFVGACAERYGKDTLFFEVNNEVDQLDFWRGTPEEYIEYCRWSAEEIRRFAPGVPIANGGYAYGCSEPGWTGIIARGVRDMVDWVTYHSHGGVPELKPELHAIEAIVAAAGYEQPVLANTEMGYAAWRLDVERNMAATAVQKLLYCWTHGNRGSLLYLSRDIGGPRGGDWGMLDYTFCPRFMYGTVGAFIQTLAGAEFQAALHEGPDFHAYAFRRDEDLIVAVYSPEASTSEASLTTDAASITRVDAMGNAEEFGDTTITVDLMPSFYLLRSASSCDISPL